jgi:hypothetical protein
MGKRPSDEGKEPKKALRGQQFALHSNVNGGRT